MNDLIFTIFIIVLIIIFLKLLNFFTKKKSSNVPSSTKKGIKKNIILKEEVIKKSSNVPSSTKKTQEEININQEEIKKIKKEKQDLEVKLRTFQKEIDRLKEELNKKETLPTFNSQTNELNIEIQKLKKELKERKKTIDNFLSINDNQKKSIEKLKEELKEIKNIPDSVDFLKKIKQVIKHPMKLKENDFVEKYCRSVNVEKYLDNSNNFDNYDYTPPK
jgi:chromosome segregation ATPase